MRYWDTSALVPVLVEEGGTPRMRALLEADPGIATWGWTRVEVAGALERRLREGRIGRSECRAAHGRLSTLAKMWDEVTDLLAVRVRALALLGRHPLRAADAAQLGAALLAAEQDPAGLPFVCLDARLALAAEKEGMEVLGPE